MFDFLDKVEELSQANITIREQARLAENPLDLRYQSLFPVQPATSLKISELLTVDFRPAGGRRDWNAQPREIPERTGKRINAEIAPINTSKHLDEHRLTALRMGGQGIQEVVNRGILHDVNTWPTALSDAVERNLEAEAFEAWQTSVVTVQDTNSNAQITIALDIDPARYVVEATPWSDATVDAYVRMLTLLEEANSLLPGGVGGIRMRRSQLKRILISAPLMANGVRMTADGLTERISQEKLGDNVQFVIDERTYDRFTGAGAETAQTWYVQPGKLLFQAVGDGRVGATYQADVERAYSFMSPSQLAAGGANGVVNIRSAENNGRTLLLEAQKNAFAAPDEQRVFVATTG